MCWGRLRAPEAAWAAQASPFWPSTAVKAAKATLPLRKPAVLSSCAGNSRTQDAEQEARNAAPLASKVTAWCFAAGGRTSNLPTLAKEMSNPILSTYMSSLCCACPTAGHEANVDRVCLASCSWCSEGVRQRALMRSQDCTLGSVRTRTSYQFGRALQVLARVCSCSEAAVTCSCSTSAFSLEWNSAA